MSQSTLEIRQVLVVSTAHLTKATCLHFKEWPRIADYEEGCYVYAGTGDDSPAELYPDAPEDLRIVLEFARRHNCIEVKFDQDADVVEGLPVYNWDAPVEQEDVLVPCLVQDLKEGMYVDLASCPYLKDRPIAQLCYGYVTDVCEEDDNSVVVSYDSLDLVGYPRNTVLQVKAEHEAD